MSDEAPQVTFELTAMKTGDGRLLLTLRSTGDATVRWLVAPGELPALIEALVRRADAASGLPERAWPGR